MFIEGLIRILFFHVSDLYFQNCGFITFDKSDSAEQAILEHNNSYVQGIQIKVGPAPIIGERPK